MGILIDTRALHRNEKTESKRQDGIWTRNGLDAKADMIHNLDLTIVKRCIMYCTSTEKVVGVAVGVSHTEYNTEYNLVCYVENTNKSNT
jgi:hypothetical protein